MEKKTIENTDYNYELHTQIENLKIIREWINDIGILLEKMNINNIQKQIDEAYQNGYKTCMQENDFDSPCTSCEDYQRGVEDGRNETWEAARKIVCDEKLDWNTLLHLFNKGNFTGIFGDFSASEVIAKLKAYEEKQKTDEDVKRGDVVIRIDGDKRYLVTYADNDRVYGINEDGKWCGADLKAVARTGEHYDIDKILKGMEE